MTEPLSEKDIQNVIAWQIPVKRHYLANVVEVGRVNEVVEVIKKKLWKIRPRECEGAKCSICRAVNLIDDWFGGVTK